MKKVISKLFQKIFKPNPLSKLGSIGFGCHIEGGFFGRPENIHLGNHIYIGPNAYIAGRGGVIIENGTIIGPRVTIHSSNHRYDGDDLKAIPYDGVTELRQVSIGENVWIGDSVLICPGVTIGEGAVIAMGTVVSKNVPSLSVVAGNPFKIIKYRDKERYQRLKKDEKIYLSQKFKNRIETNERRI